MAIIFNLIREVQAKLDQKKDRSIFKQHIQQNK